MTRVLPKPMIGEQYTVAVDFDDTLSHTPDRKDLKDNPGPPLPNAIWALKVFKLNNWRVELFTCRSDYPTIESWIQKHASGLIDGVNSTREPASGYEWATSLKPRADVFIDDRDWFSIGTSINWVSIIQTLAAKGFLKEIIPLE